ncbi:hypothetical protein LOD99_12226 [Oopsacas minuta]|uniref:Uncharacterized protein n=1 Tax=Oopsacas minuta TaxID=111878 RepID=A0AAV7JEU7_9METZ|nr:hypothetical protein LOD99_12226 [Oopsacas minuta]
MSEIENPQQQDAQAEPEAPKLEAVTADADLAKQEAPTAPEVVEEGKEIKEETVTKKDKGSKTSVCSVI